MSDTTTEAPVLDLLTRMTTDSFESSSLDIDTLMPGQSRHAGS